jgi:hypothetical protein
MPDDRLHRLLKQLIEKTSDDTLKWDNVHPENGVYRYSAPRSRVEVSSEDLDNQPPYVVAVFNADGVAVDIVSESHDRLGGLVRQLGELVRDKHLKAAETYTDLFRDLDSLPPF